MSELRMTRKRRQESIEEKRMVGEAFRCAAMATRGVVLDNPGSISEWEERTALAKASQQYAIQDDRQVPLETAIAHCPALTKPYLHVAICLSQSGKITPRHIWTKTAATPTEPKGFWMWADGIPPAPIDGEFDEF